MTVHLGFHDVVHAGYTCLPAIRFAVNEFRFRSRRALFSGGIAHENKQSEAKCKPDHIASMVVMPNVQVERRAATTIAK